MACVNCNIDFDGDFCPTCGEKKNIERITFTSILTSIFSGFVDMDKGLLFNLKNLTLHPQKTILQYVKGKRRQILNPVSYAIITISVYLFIDSILPRGKSINPSKFDFYGTQEMGMKLGYFIRDKMKFLWLTYTFYCAIFSKLFFRKYNFFEHLAINCFIVGHATIIAIITRIIYTKELIIFNVFVFIYISILQYKVYKNPKDKFGTGGMAVLIVFLSYLLFLGVPFIIANFFN